MRILPVTVGLSASLLLGACKLPSTPTPEPSRPVSSTSNPNFQPSQVAAPINGTGTGPQQFRRVGLPPSVLNRMLISTHTPPPAVPSDAPTPTPTGAPAPAPTPTAAPTPAP